MKSKLLIATLIAASAHLAVAAPSERASTVAFNRTDRNHDAELDHDEFESLLPKTKGKSKKKGAPAEEVAAGLQIAADTAFAWFDSDGSDTISLEEWLAGRSGTPLPPPEPPAEDPNAPAEDPNAPAEDPNAPEEPVDETPESPDLALVPFAAVDRNGNGTVNFGEFQNVFKKIVPTNISKIWFSEFIELNTETPEEPTTEGTDSAA